MRRFGFQGEMHPLVAAVLFGMPRGNPLEPNAQAESPDRQFAEPIQRMRRREGQPVVGADRVRQANVVKRALKHAEGVAFLVVDSASQASR